MEKTFEYHWLFTPTGQQGTSHARAWDRPAMLELINKWNRQATIMNERWVYWL